MRRWFRWVRALLLALVVGSLAACGTPGPVKELSQAQVAAFDTVIQAATVHHETLIAAAERIAQDRKQRIDERTKGLADDAVSEIRNNPGQTKSTVLTYSTVVQQAEADKAKLDADVAEIERLSNQLVESLKEMRQAQQALSAYLETEAVGEAFISSVSRQQTVAGFTQHVTDAINEATSVSQRLKSAIDALGS